MNKEVVILDYGSGNLHSIAQALSKCGAKISITDVPSAIAKTSHLVIPGVGAFGGCMAKIEHRGLIPPVIEAVNRGALLLGICVGMQILFDEGEEFGHHEGLGLIPGKVVAMPGRDSNGTKRKIPFVGWSPLQIPPDRDWTGTVLQDLVPGNACYFVHSFMAIPQEEKHHLADTYYGKTRVCAAVRSGNIFGCQFHPEKSGSVGLTILKRFLNA